MTYATCLAASLVVACTAADEVQPYLSSDSIWTGSGSSYRLDPTKLPLGSTIDDKKYVTDAPRAGYVYACDPRMFNFEQIIGSRVAGPWIDEQARTYDMTKKLVVQGAVTWSGSFSITASGERRVVTGNGLPVGSPTGAYPIASSDPAYAIDRNPNSIIEQNIAFSVPLHPSFADRPACEYKSVGITLDGIQIDGPLDSSGRDETAYQLSDLCFGRAQPGGLYHRNTLNDCSPGMTESNALVGYALDGFGIYSMFDANGNEITSADLDECHGMTSEVVFDGVKQVMYHYVLTRDWPYSITCFRGTPTYDAFPMLPM